MRVRAYECFVTERPEFRRTINHATASKARMEYLRDLWDAGYEDYSFKHITVRSLGAPLSSEGFLRNAQYRGISEWRCGDRVRAKDGDTGVIVGHNSSANLDILYETGRYAGQVLNTHPHGLERITDAAPGGGRE